MLLTAAFTFLAVSQLTATMPAGGFAGYWKVNFSKSKFPGTPPQVDECKVAADGTVTVNETNSEGKSTTWHYTPSRGKAGEGRRPGQHHCHRKKNQQSH